MPTIAAIAGACTGGGAGIAAACDLRIAARNARFGFPVARTLGNCLSMSNYARLDRPDRPGARHRDHLHRAAGRGRGSQIHRPGLRAAATTRPPCWPAPTRWRALIAGHAPLTLARHQGGAAPPAPAPAGGPGQGPDPDVLHERRFPRGHGRVPVQARPRLARGVARLGGCRTIAARLPPATEPRGPRFGVRGAEQDRWIDRAAHAFDHAISRWRGRGRKRAQAGRRSREPPAKSAISGKKSNQDGGRDRMALFN